MPSTEALPFHSALPQAANPDFSFADAVAEGAAIAVREAIAAHHLAGHPVVVWHGGQVMHFNPDGTYTPIEREPASGE